MEIGSTIFGSALIAVMLLSCPFTAPQEAGTPLPSSLPNASAPPPNAHINASPPANAALPDKIGQEWALINKSNVEAACLSSAKKTAVDAGYGEGLVFSCACNAQESAVTKSYGCSVSALDGMHPVSINCTKSERACIIAAQGSEVTYTFDQLQALANQ